MTIINTVTTAPDIKMGAREVKPTSFPTEVLPPEGYNALSKATIVAPDNLEPENIKKGVDIAGVVGTLDAVAGASKLPQVVDKTVTEITAEDLKGCTKIGSYVFYNCPRLVSVQLPTTITALEVDCFAFCTSIKSMTIPDTVTSLGRSSFEECAGLTTITLSSNISSIPDSCFSKCRALTTFTIPQNISEIGSYNLYWAISLTNLYVKPTTPPTLGSYFLYNTPDSLVITVPKGSLNAYKTATNWSAYADKMVEASE